MPELAEWESFHVIVGSAAGALIGLQFVVMALIAERPQIASPEAGAAFATPTIVHFSAVLSCPQFCGLHGRRPPPLPRFGVSLASLEWRMARSSPGACGRRRHINRTARTGCFMSWCRWRRIRFSSCRHSRPAPLPTRLCSALAPRRCSFSSSAFTTSGTPSSTTYLSTRGTGKTERRRALATRPRLLQHGSRTGKQALVSQMERPSADFPRHDPHDAATAAAASVTACECEGEASG